MCTISYVVSYSILKLNLKHISILLQKRNAIYMYVYHIIILHIYLL
jgi:hypothetical protein